MKKYYPYKTSLKILRVIGFLFNCLLTYLCTLFLKPYPIIMTLAIVLFWTFYIVVLLIAMPIYFAKTNYYISTNEVAKQSGIIYFTRQLMRTDSIQYMTYFSTPLSKYTGFNFLVFNALGGKVVFLFLSKKDSDEISSTISAIIRQKSRL